MAPAVPRHTPYNKPTITHDPAQRGPDTIIAEVHIVEVQMLSVAPDLLEFDFVAVGRVLIRFEGVGGAGRDEVDSADACDLRGFAGAAGGQGGGDVG